MAAWAVIGFAADEKPVPVKLKDDEVTKLLVGKWEDSARGNTTVILFKKDGTFERVDKIMGNSFAVGGKWAVKDGVLTFEAKDLPTVKGTITAINEKEHKIEMEAGARYTRTKVKE